jgi:hypothetical protein
VPGPRLTDASLSRSPRRPEGDPTAGQTGPSALDSSMRSLPPSPGSLPAIPSWYPPLLRTDTRSISSRRMTGLRSDHPVPRQACRVQELDRKVGCAPPTVAIATAPEVGDPRPAAVQAPPSGWSRIRSGELPAIPSLKIPLAEVRDLPIRDGPSRRTGSGLDAFEEAIRIVSRSDAAARSRAREDPSRPARGRASRSRGRGALQSRVELISQ